MKERADRHPFPGTLRLKVAQDRGLVPVTNPLRVRELLRPLEDMGEVETELVTEYATTTLGGFIGISIWRKGRNGS